MPDCSETSMKWEKSLGLGVWWLEYDEERDHDGIGGLTPSEYVAQHGHIQAYGGRRLTGTGTSKV